MAKSSHLFVLVMLCLGVGSAMILDNVQEDSTEEIDSTEDQENSTSEEQGNSDEEMVIDSTVKLDPVPTTDSSVKLDPVPTTDSPVKLDPVPTTDPTVTDPVPTTDSTVERKTQGPSRPATPKPGCSSYVSCPWVYPQPVPTESSNSAGTSTTAAIEMAESENDASSSTQKPISAATELSESENPTTQVPLVNYFGSSESNETVPSETDNNQESSNDGKRPSIPATPKPQYPSFVPGPWIYPRPIDEQHVSGHPLVQPIPGFGVRLPQFPSFNPFTFGVNRWPPPYPMFFPTDSLTTKTVDDKPPGVQSSGDGSTTTKIPDCPPYVSCPWIYPIPITDEPSVEQTWKDPSSEEQDSIVNSSNNSPDAIQITVLTKPSSNTNTLGSVSPQSSNPPTLENDIYGVLSVDIGDDAFSDPIFFDDPVAEKKEELARATEILQAMIYGNTPFVFRQKNKPSIVML